MKRHILALTLTTASGALALAGDDSASEPRLRIQPSLYVMGTLEDTRGICDPIDRELLGPGQGMSLGGGLDASWRNESSRVQVSLLGLVDDAFASDERTYLLAGRVHASRALGRNLRLTFDDAPRLQRRPALTLTDYGRNQISAGIEWQAAPRTSWTLQISDRRRDVNELSRLDFNRQALRLTGTRSLGTTSRLAVSLDALHFAGPSARGEDGVLTVEMAHLSRHRTVSLRAAWFLPIDHRRDLVPQGGLDGTYIRTGTEPPSILTGAAPPVPAPGTEIELVGDSTLLLADTPVGRTTSGDPGIGAFVDPFLFDPLESDSDEWEFGRNRQVLAGLLSQPLGTRARATLVGRIQHSFGSNLLADPDADTHPEESRLWLRLSLRYRLWHRISVFGHGGYLRNWSSDDGQDFTRILFTTGAQIGF